MAILTRGEYDKLRNQNEKTTSKSTIMTKNEYDKLDKTQLFSGNVLKKYNETLAKKNLDEKQNKYDNALKQNLQNIKDLNLDYSLKPFSTGTDKTLKTGSTYLPTAENREKIKNNQEIINNSSKVQESRKATTDALNDLRLAQYQYDVAKEENHTPTLWDKTVGVPIRATKDLLSMFSLTNNPSTKLYKDDNGNKSFLPTANELRQQNVSNSYETKIGKLLSDITYNGTKILGSSVLPGGNVVYWGDMFNDSFINTVNDGYNENDSLLYATLSTASELITSKLMGGLSKLVPGGSSELSKTINKTLNKVMKNDRLRSVLSNALSEGSEEFVQEYVDLLNRNLVLGENNKFDLKTFENALYSGLVGMGTGGISGAVNVDVNTNNTGIIPQTNKNGVIDVETYVQQLQEAKNKETNQNRINKINETLNQLGVKTNTNQNRENSNIKKYNENDINRFLTGDNLIDGVNSNINSFVNDYYDSTTKKAKKHKVPIKTKKMFLGRINDNLASKLNTLLNNSKMIKKLGKIYDTTDTNIVLSSNNIEHIYNHHGNEKNIGQIDVTPENLSKYGEVISNPDYIGLSAQLSRGNTPTFYFTKRINGYSVAVEVLSTKKQLYPESYYIFDSNSTEYWDFIKNNKLKKAEDVESNDIMSNDINAQGDTSVAFYDNNDTIKPSKSQLAPLPNTNNMQNNQDNSINVPPVENNKTQNDNNNNQPSKIAEILEERPVAMEEKDSWLKKLTTIKILDKGYYVDKLARQENNRELSSKYDYMLMANGIAQQIIGNERFNPKTQKTYGDGLHKIFEPIENSGKLKDFSEYMYHKHNISRMSLDTLFQEENKPIFDDSITSEVSKSIVEKYESENPEFIEWAQEIYEYNNFLLDILVDYEVISSEDKQYYNKKYPYYVPTIRVNDKTKVQMDFIGKKASVNNPIKTAKGGNQDIIPLKEAMALRTMQTLNSALRNNFGNELLNTIQVDSNSNKVNIDEVIGDDIDTEDFLTKSDKKSPSTLTVFKNGEKTTFDITDEIYEALAPSQRYKFKIPNTFSKIRRGLITEYNPAFMLTNPIKDIQDGTLNSKHPTLFLKNIAEATKQIATKGEFYKSYIANGGSYETYFNYGEGYNKMPTKRNWYDPRKILDKISQANQYIEMTPRLAEYISSIEAGDSMETAMYNAQEITTNFKRGGDWTKNADVNGVTFLNASVQGTVKQIRNFQDAKSQGIKGMMNLAVKWSIAGLTPYILSQLIWNDDDDYEELSDYVKNNYYILWKNNDGTFIRIPKGRVLSVIQNLFKQGLDTLKGKKIDILEFGQLLENQVLPSDPTESNIISPILDVMQNKAWHGGTLVPQRLQNLPEGEQYDESTDSISIWLGKKLGISPIKINYILDQYSGAIGDIILPTLTLEAENDSNSFLSNIVAPLKSKFTTDSVMNNQNIRDLYDLDDELTKKSKSSNATKEDILKSKYINAIQTEMNKLTAEKRNIQNDTTLTNNEKYKQVKEIQMKINTLAKEGLNNYQKIELYDNYAKVGNKEYYLNSSNEWQKLDTTTAKYKTVKQITTYDKYLTYQKNIDEVKDKYDNTNQRKSAVINYVNSLKLSIPQKAMLIKLNYSSYDTYNKQIIEYIVNQKLTATEKSEILTKLGFTVKDGRVYY